MFYKLVKTVYRYANPVPWKTILANLELIWLHLFNFSKSALNNKSSTVPLERQFDCIQNDMYLDSSFHLTFTEWIPPYRLYPAGLGREYVEINKISTQNGVLLVRGNLVIFISNGVNLCGKFSMGHLIYIYFAEMSLCLIV